MITWRLRILSTLAAAGFKADRVLIVLSIVVGGLTGLGAHLFYSLLEYAFHHTLGEEGMFALGRGMLILMPVLGAVAVGMITSHFPREARGHGVPEVMDATYRGGGIIRPRVALAKAVASVFTIGTGGSAGTEGPIVQIGAAIGSSVGQTLGLKRDQLNTLVACGVASGIAAIFNAPIAGVLFALEIFLRDFSFRTFSPIVFASVISTSLSHALRPDEGGIFEVDSPELYRFYGAELPYYLVLGVFCALAAVAFIRLLDALEGLFEGMRVPDLLKPVIGATALGLTGIAYVSMSTIDPVPPFFGNGYPTIRAAIGPELMDVSIVTLVTLVGLKLVATSFTLGSGGSGGIFAPSLFVGACVGGAFGLALSQMGLIEARNAPAYAIVGMAAVVAATTHAPLTAIVILYELTREPTVILPIMFAAIVATGIARYLFRDSIYTLKLTRRGVRVGRLADVTILKRIQADQVRIIPAPVVRPFDPLHRLLEMAKSFEANDFIVVDDDNDYVGMVVAEDIRTALLQPEAVPLLVVTELARPGVPAVTPTETLDAVMDKFARADVNALPYMSTTDGQKISGLVTRQAVMDRYQQELERTG